MKAIEVGEKDRPVLLSRPSKDGFARLDGHLWKNTRLMPVLDREEQRRQGGDGAGPNNQNVKF